MNRRSLLLLVWSLALSAVSAATPPNYSPMKVVQTVPVQYPRQLADLGLTTGEVCVSVQIDETGKLTDHLVTAYSHPKFAESAVQALQKWRYEPAVLNGEARSATAELNFMFETRGMVVVNMNVSSYVEMRDLQLRPTAHSYSVCRLSELDGIPNPAKVVTPVYPPAADKRRQGATITVFFYIDEKGHVRLPAVSRASSEENEMLAAAALQAVSQWEFDPPLSKGRPVLVAARQDFHFKPVPVEPAKPVATAGVVQP